MIKPNVPQSIVAARLLPNLYMKYPAFSLSFVIIVRITANRKVPSSTDMIDLMKYSVISNTTMYPIIISKNIEGI